MKNLILSVLGAAVLGLGAFSLSGCSTAERSDMAACCAHAQAEGKACTEPCCTEAMAEHQACKTCMSAGCGAEESASSAACETGTDCGSCEGGCCEDSTTGAQNKN